jgi:hypothetical protein
MSERPAAPPASSQSELASLTQGWQPVSHAILADGVLAVIGADVDLEDEHRRLHAAWASSSPLDPPSQVFELAASGAARIWIAAPAGWTEGPIFPLENPFPNIDRFADGRWLVVGARTRGGANARVIGADGGELDRFMLGDGIEQVAIDQSDRIWVGWFDEGVFGNESWRVPGQEWPPSGHGLACFADDGALLMAPSWPSEAGYVADCYALNAVGRGAWSCPYMDFPLFHCVPDQPVRWWRNPVPGARAMAVDGARVLLAGGYGVEANRLVLLGLHGIGRGEDAREIASWSLPLHPRAAANEWEPVWEPPTLLVGRGDAMHLIDGGVWRTWRVGDLTAI